MRTAKGQDSARFFIRLLHQYVALPSIQRSNTYSMRISERKMEIDPRTQGTMAHNREDGLLHPIP